MAAPGPLLTRPGRTGPQSPAPLSACPCNLRVGVAFIFVSSQECIFWPQQDRKYVSIRLPLTVRTWRSRSKTHPLAFAPERGRVGSANLISRAPPPGPRASSGAAALCTGAAGTWAPGGGRQTRCSPAFPAALGLVTFRDTLYPWCRTQLPATAPRPWTPRQVRSYRFLLFPGQNDH